MRAVLSAVLDICVRYQGRVRQVVSRDVGPDSARHVQPCALVGGELQIDRREALVQLSHGRGTDQRDHRYVATDEPGQDHLVDGRTGFLCPPR